MTVVSVVATLFILADLGSPQAAGTDAGLARVGDDLALVLIADGASEVAASRQAIADWGLLAPAFVLSVGAVLAWWGAGRIYQRLDFASSSIDLADERRQRHLNEVVHELRTPLAVMGTNLELASDSIIESRYLEAARRAVTRMARTVDDLAGHGQLAVEAGNDPADLAAIAESVGQEHAGPGRARGVFVRLAESGPVILESVDESALRTVIANFMSNAMRFAPRGSVVGIDWGTVGDWSWLSVSDQGPGIAPRDHSRVFERGWQGSHDRDRKSGSGLGLAIARQLTEAQGGHVTVEAEEGGGATFAIWLPHSDDAATAAILADDGVHPMVHPWLDELVEA
jgi:two-component system sensor histidine kinase BaeS